VLVNVAFITLLERKILGYSQLRKGPNKVRFLGIRQPLNDAIKLFSKEVVYPYSSNYIQYIISPRLALCIVLILFRSIPVKEHIVSISSAILLIYTFIRINVYPLLISGWASNRKYALIGALRAVAQTISYEVILALILLFYLGLRIRINFLNIRELNRVFRKLFIFFPLAIV
jgi:NADH-ubiquinone oxidoreductase chain 1